MQTELENAAKSKFVLYFKRQRMVILNFGGSSWNMCNNWGKVMELIESPWNTAGAGLLHRSVYFCSSCKQIPKVLKLIQNLLLWTAVVWLEFFDLRAIKTFLFHSDPFQLLYINSLSANFQKR